MKTALQKHLATIAPSISIQTIWEHDPDHEREFIDLSRNPGDCFYGEERDDWQCWQSEICATAIQCGEEVTGHAYLGGTWEKAGDVPSESNPDISGYEAQLTVEELEELYEKLSITTPGAQEIAHQITTAIEHINSKA